MKRLPIYLLLLLAPLALVAQTAPSADLNQTEEVDLEQLDAEAAEAPALRYQDAVNILNEELVVEMDETTVIRSLAQEELRKALDMNDELAWRAELLQARMDMISAMNKDLMEQNRMILQENEDLIGKEGFVNEEAEDQINNNLAIIALNEKQIEENLHAAEETEQLMADLEMLLDENESRIATAEDLLEDCDLLLANFAYGAE